MDADGRAAARTAAVIGAALLLAGCTGSTPTATPTTGATPSAATDAARISCDSIQVRDLDTEPGGWTLAEAVALRGPAGMGFTVTLPAESAASVALGEPPGTPTTPGRTPTITEALQLTPERATVTPDPPIDLDPATLLAAIDLRGTAPLSSTSTGQAGLAGSLQGELGPDTTVVYRGARRTTVAFAGDCTGPTGEPVPVTGSGRYFAEGSAGVLDCGQPPPDPGTLAALAARHCSTG